jgi:5-methylcytosine-specific restriction endonuclease McrA
MAVAPRHPCARCGAFIRGKCPRCAPLQARARDQARPGATARGYDTQWAEFSQKWLSQFPWCGQRIDGRLHADHSRCVQDGKRVYAECTDHITALRAGGRKYDRGNLQSLCTACNLRKGIEHEGGFGRPPKDPKWLLP